MRGPVSDLEAQKPTHGAPAIQNKNGKYDSRDGKKPVKPCKAAQGMLPLETRWLSTSSFGERSSENF